ncbi:hypothetical protein O6H91_15G082000 [Diphasiastrum complanatum]|uniref:Uncharacterized protein n=2 Tax=Diphasiastrum complanatum TaxID=34168 RepID=A0ACC2BKB8_DIPCM|nr:hypothetical protein O6H91_15G073100 [Diphasiastrum complanatum]KAJ7530153.1 hypothetical protein O6H91_15G082000 [Diphasiastrum complanatum]
MEMDKDVLRNATVQQLVQNKRRLIEVPCTATVGDTLNVLLANDVVAVPVAAPPGQWIGAGGSMIVESDKSTGGVRKQYIGMVSVLDVLIHVSEEDESGELDLEGKLSTPVSSIIGHSIEGLSLWTISPSTSIYEALEPMSKGIHRALVPIESHIEHATGVELNESSPGYHMMTQTDLVQYIQHHAKELKPIISSSVVELGALQHHVFAVPADMKVMDAVKCMRNASLNAVAIVEASANEEKSSVISGIGRKLVGTFSASDLRGCTSDVLRAWSSLSVLEFSRKAFLARRYGFRNVLAANEMEESEMMKPVTCSLHTSLEEVISNALERHIRRIWVVDSKGHLEGLVALSDILRAVRESTR